MGGSTGRLEEIEEHNKRLKGNEKKFWNNLENLNMDYYRDAIMEWLVFLV